MGTGPKIAIGAVVIIILLVVGLPIVAGLANQPQEASGQPNDTAQTGTATDSPAPATVQPQVTPQPQQPQGPQQWTQQNLGGTAWSIFVPQVNSSIVIQLNPGGSATANTPMGAVQGNWNVSGNRLNVSAMGQQVSCIIQGWRIYLPTGGQAQRVQ